MTQNAQQLLRLVASELSLADESERFSYKAKSDHYYVAFSGGVDSTVLLHLMKQLQSDYGFNLTALHVNHNIDDDSSVWEQQCLNYCEKIDVDFKSVSLMLDSTSEESARDARYDWFKKTIKLNSVLLTAHHRQDRVETLLFNLMRGAGSTGLSSMRSVRPFYGSTLQRPLLQVTRADIVSCAKDAGLNWIEDPSNQENTYSRNHIRNIIIPSLTEFRGDAVQNIARSAHNLEQENSLLREVAIGDLVEVREHPKHRIDGSYAICYEDFQFLSVNRQSNLVRFWLSSLNLHVPSQRLLNQLLECFVTPPKSTAVLQEAGFQFRFYRGYMYVMPALEETQSPRSIDWSNVEQPVDLVEQKVRVGSTDKLRDLCSLEKHSNLRLVSREELNNPKALQGHSLNMKTWLQDIGVPPWRRTALPLLTIADSGNDVVLGAVDQQLDSDWVSLQCAMNEYQNGQLNAQ